MARSGHGGEGQPPSGRRAQGESSIESTRGTAPAPWRADAARSSRKTLHSRGGPIGKGSTGGAMPNKTQIACHEALPASTFDRTTVLEEGRISGSNLKR